MSSGKKIPCDYKGCPNAAMAEVSVGLRTAYTCLAHEEAVLVGLSESPQERAKRVFAPDNEPYTLAEGFEKGMARWEAAWQKEEADPEPMRPLRNLLFLYPEAYKPVMGLTTEGGGVRDVSTQRGRYQLLLRLKPIEGFPFMSLFGEAPHLTFPHRLRLASLLFQRMKELRDFAEDGEGDAALEALLSGTLKDRLRWRGYYQLAWLSQAEGEESYRQTIYFPIPMPDGLTRGQVQEVAGFVSLLTCQYDKKALGAWMARPWPKSFGAAPEKMKEAARLRFLAENGPEWAFQKGPNNAAVAFYRQRETGEV